MAITSMQAIKLTKPPSGSGRRETQGGSETQGSAGQGITIREAEKMLCALKDQGWFEKSSQGYFSLGPRALMELRGWLIETYNDAEESEDENGAARVPKIKFCQACKDIVTVVSRPWHYSPLVPIRATTMRWLIASTSDIGPVLPEGNLPLQATRDMHTQLFSCAEIEEVPSLQERLEWRGLCRRESGCVIGIIWQAEKRRRLSSQGLEPGGRGKGKECWERRRG